MSREIKFRAWDNKKGEWYKPVHEAYKGNLFEMNIMLSGQLSFRVMGNLRRVELHHENLPEYRDRFLLMQYTGLKDKNGKEIYEGDILKENGEVKWCDKDMCGEYGCIGWDGIMKGGYTGWNTDEKDEIIGNIHENQELLKDAT